MKPSPGPWPGGEPQYISSQQAEKKVVGEILAIGLLVFTRSSSLAFVETNRLSSHVIPVTLES